MAKCTKIDNTISPPGYEIYILARDSYVETERHRLLTIGEAVLYRQQQSVEREVCSSDARRSSLGSDDARDE